LRIKYCLIAAVTAAWSGCAWAESQPTLEQDAVDFGTRQAVASMDLSPDGKLAVFVGAGPGRTTMIYIADIAAGNNKPILYSKGSPDSIQWCSFASNARLICRFTAMIPSDGSAVSPGVLIPVSRTISLDTAGKDIKPLGQQSTSSDLGIRQFDGSIIDWLPGGGDSILMTRLFLAEGSRGVPTNVQRTKSGVGVVRLNVQTLATETVEQPKDAVFKWMSDGEGHVRVLGISEVSGETYETGRVKYVYRTIGSRDWKPLAGYVDVKDFQPLAIDGATNSLYAIRKYEGRWALSRLSLDDAPTETVVAHDPALDIDHVSTVGESGRVVGYGYDGVDSTVYFNASYKALASSLQAALPNHPSIKFVGESSDSTKIALFAGSTSDPGRYYLFDRVAKSLGELIPARPSLAGRKLAVVQTVSYPATDGTIVTARLFLPPGKPPKSLPTVIFTGGASGYKDLMGFEWLPQFLAARGYAVLEPRYRGFGGGDAWFNTAGFKGWQTSVGDVSAAARFVVSQGVADPGRLAIAGWSHGGYTALLSAESDPALYKAVIAVAPITDLASYKEDWFEYTAGKQIADAITGASAEASPARRASAIQAPVLLVHGVLDVNERVTQSRVMRDALQKSGKSVELVEFEGLDRELDDSGARSTMLVKMGQLLERTIGH